MCFKFFMVIKKRCRAIALKLNYFHSGVKSKCTKGYDGVSFSCEDEFVGKRFSLTVDADTCQTNPKIKVEMIIAALGIDWKKTIDASQEIPIPGFNYGFAGGVNLKVKINSNPDGTTMLKVSLFLSVLTNEIYTCEISEKYTCAK